MTCSVVQNVLAALAMAGFVLARPSLAKADLITQWTFETSTPASAGPISPETGSGAATGYHVGASAYSSPVGNGSAHSFSSNTWAVNDYYQFQTSTVGYTGISISFDQTSSNTGPKDFLLQYSTNGTNFTNVSTYSVLANASPNAFWTSTTYNPVYTFADNLSSVAALSGAQNVYFRLIDADNTSANGGAVGSTGTDRVDNFTVSGTVVSQVPEPPVAAMFGAAVPFLLALRRRRSV